MTFKTDECKVTSTARGQFNVEINLSISEAIEAAGGVEEVLNEIGVAAVKKHFDLAEPVAE